MADQKSLVTEEQLPKINGGVEQEPTLINKNESPSYYSAEENKKYIPGHNEQYFDKK